MGRNWPHSALSLSHLICMNNSSVDVIFASSRREPGGGCGDFPGGPPPDEYLIGRCVCVWRISHTQVRVCVCASASAQRTLSSGPNLFWLPDAGRALGFNYSRARAPHLPPPEIYCRETLRFITTTPGVWNFNTRPPICGAICDCWSSVLIYTHVVGLFIDPQVHNTQVHLFYVYILI